MKIVKTKKRPTRTKKGSAAARAKRTFSPSVKVSTSNLEVIKPKARTMSKQIPKPAKTALVTYTGRSKDSGPDAPFSVSSLSISSVATIGSLSVDAANVEPAKAETGREKACDETGVRVPLGIAKGDTFEPQICLCISV